MSRIRLFTVQTPFVMNYCTAHSFYRCLQLYYWLSAILGASTHDSWFSDSKSSLISSALVYSFEMYEGGDKKEVEQESFKVLILSELVPICIQYPRRGEGIYFILMLLSFIVNISYEF